MVPERALAPPPRDAGEERARDMRATPLRYCCAVAVSRLSDETWEERPKHGLPKVIWVWNTIWDLSIMGAPRGAPGVPVDEGHGRAEQDVSVDRLRLLRRCGGGEAHGAEAPLAQLRVTGPEGQGATLGFDGGGGGYSWEETPRTSERCSDVPNTTATW